jgi:SMI1 / KNR4 family (SUKH-1)
MTMTNTEEYLYDFEKLKERVPESTIAKLQAELDFELPKDYLEVIRWYNGSEGEVGKGYLILLPISDLVKANQDCYYLVNGSPGYFLFGQNAATTAYIFSKNKSTYHEVEFISGSEDSLVFCGNSFLEFLEYLYRDH